MRNAVSLGEWFPTFRRDYCVYILGTSSASALFSNSLNPEYESNSVLRNVEDELPNYMASYHKNLNFRHNIKCQRFNYLRANPQKFWVPERTNSLRTSPVNITGWKLSWNTLRNYFCSVHNTHSFPLPNFFFTPLSFLTMKCVGLHHCITSGVRLRHPAAQ